MFPPERYLLGVPTMRLRHLRQTNSSRNRLLRLTNKQREQTHRYAFLFIDMSFWLKSGQENLRRNLAYRYNENRAKNIIIFIGDGMGMSTITAGRIYKGQTKGSTGEEYKLAFEKFPNTGFAKVENIKIHAGFLSLLLPFPPF